MASLNICDLKQKSKTRGCFPQLETKDSIFSFILIRLKTKLKTNQNKNKMQTNKNEQNYTTLYLDMWLLHFVHHWSVYSSDTVRYFIDVKCWIAIET